MSNRANHETVDAPLGIEGQLFKTADKLRGSMEPSEYKHVVLGLLFLKHISTEFEKQHAQLLERRGEGAAEDRDRYMAEGVFWVPKEARWSHLQANAKQPDIGKRLDDAMTALERENKELKGALPKEYARPNISAETLGGLVDLVSNIDLQVGSQDGRDVLGRVYEYFLAEFAGSEGKRGGEFYTPTRVVQLLVEMLEPYQGRVYDPCCGSGGMFVQSEKFVERHGGRMADISVYGQELNHTTWRLCRMNLAIRGIDGQIEWNSDGTFHRDAHPDLRSDFVLANPPFNVSDWGGDRLRDDVRWRYGAPPTGNANYAWLQHILHHLAPNGTAGVILANGSMSSMQSGEGEIRKAMVEEDVVDCMVALPGQLFYSTQIPVCVWFLAKNKSNGRFRDRSGEVLFIDARRMGEMVDRTRRELTLEDIQLIAGTYHAWREGEGYQDVPGFCRSASIDEVREHQHVLTPGRYVGTAELEEDAEPFGVKMARLENEWRDQRARARQLDALIEASLEGLHDVD